MTCLTCGSRGFDPSVLPDRCTFCDGTVGGHPPEDCHDCGSPTNNAEGGRCAACSA
jgi:hypothetical protein